MIRELRNKTNAVKVFLPIKSNWTNYQFPNVRLLPDSFNLSNSNQFRTNFLLRQNRMRRCWLSDICRQCSFQKWKFLLSSSVWKFHKNIMARHELWIICPSKPFFFLNWFSSGLLLSGIQGQDNKYSQIESQCGNCGLPGQEKIEHTGNDA